MKRVEKIFKDIQKQENLLKKIVEQQTYILQNVTDIKARKLILKTHRETRKVIIKKIHLLKRQYNNALGESLRQLHEIYTKLFSVYPVRLLTHQELWSDGFIVLHFDNEFGNTAEIKDTWHLSVNEKLKLHKRLLNKLERRYKNWQLKLELVI